MGTAGCPACGPSIDSRYAAPPSALGAEPAASDGIAPWELKRWRVSGLSWAAILLACFLPPIGFVLSFFAIARAGRFRKRPGNRAVAIAALGTAFYMGLIFGYFAFIIWNVASIAERAEAYADPGLAVDPAAPAEAQPEDLAELQRLLDQLAAQQPPAE